MKRTGLQLFYAAPSGAWRLGELTFDKHDAPNGAHLNHSRIAQQNQIDLCFWDAQAPSCDCGSLPKSFVGKLLTTIGKLLTIFSSLRSIPYSNAARSR
ncbi:MAG: hypothetical protein DME99_12490 [Verrucomicrobia bacterium]|nr:MAG: hypothetical protein DME99_12490 [Verrucomicrobiota bacterium]